MAGFANSVGSEEWLEWPSRKVKVLVDRKRLPQSTLTMALCYYEPGYERAAHTHDSEVEAMYCLKGKGEIILGDQVIAFEPGTMVYAPAGVEHSLRSDPDSDLEFLAIFNPPYDF